MPVNMVLAKMWNSTLKMTQRERENGSIISEVLGTLLDIYDGVSLQI